MQKLIYPLFFLLIMGITSSCKEKATLKEIVDKKVEGNNYDETKDKKTDINGQELYTKKCTACHGSDGNMGVAGAKKIPESVLSQEEREGLIKNGKGTMPAFKDQLSDEEIEKVAEYTFSLK